MNITSDTKKITTPVGLFYIEESGEEPASILHLYHLWAEALIEKGMALSTVRGGSPTGMNAVLDCLQARSNLCDVTLVPKTVETKLDCIIYCSADLSKHHENEAIYVYNVYVRGVIPRVWDYVSSV